MKLKFQIPGTKVSSPRVEEHTSLALPNVEISEFEIQAVRAAGRDEEITCEADDVFEFVMEDDSVWYMRADDLAERIQTRSRNSGTQGQALLVIPVAFESEDGDTRSLLGDGLKQKVMRLFTNWAVGETAKGIAKMMEGRLNTGLFHIDSAFNLLPNPDLYMAGSAPYLLLIHGTGSNILGGFKSFLDEKRETWENIVRHYDDRVLGFEHRTWSESPVQNAIDLVNLLPARIELDLITHSRGGLVGEILAMTAHTGTIEDAWLDILQEDEALKKEIQTLCALIQSKQIKVRNLVRVACPIGGTTILSKRLDAWLNIVINSLRLVPGFSGNPAYEFLSDFLKAVVHERTKPETMPGLACMRPESPLIQFLNHSEVKINSRLHVISGDARSGNFWAKISVFVADLFFLEDHDLVVPVSSMRIGLPRTSPVLEHFSAEAEVNHFKYFLNEKSRTAIFQALTSDNPAASLFRPVDSESSATTRKVPAGEIFDPIRPTVFIIPGIMGTHLKNEDARLWASFPALMKGAMGKLKHNDTGISPDGLHDASYGALACFFQEKNYNVIPFGYDWRDDLIKNSELLTAKIEHILSKKDKHATGESQQAPIYFIAHSMGGLLLSLALAQKPDVFNKLKKNNKFRVLLLGVPWKGSFSTARIFLGKEAIVQRLALLDTKHSKKEIQGIIAQYPGLVQLMPRGSNQTGAFFEYWNSKIADSALLLPFKTIRSTEPNSRATSNSGAAGTSHQVHPEIQRIEDILGAFKLDPQYFKYIAGQDKQTPSALELNTKKEDINFTSTNEGDGRVPWSTIPEELLQDTYYVPVAHGALPSHEKAFEAYRELLENGITADLSRTKPHLRSSHTTDWMPSEDIVEYPSARDIDFSIGGNKQKSIQKASQADVSVTLTHGDLVQAMHPVMVGHFKGDAILNAEKVIDDQLDEQLSLRKQMGYYPEEIGDNIILLPTKGRFKGAIVLGLGEFGSLTEPNLYLTIHSALVNYVFKVAEQSESKRNSETVGVSALLIGSGFGSLLIANSVKALLDAVSDVNRLILAHPEKQIPLIRELEIIELFRYKAIQTLRLIQSILQESDFEHIKLKEGIKKVSGRRDATPDEVETGWWHRIKVEHTKIPSSIPGIEAHALAFTSLTDRARAEEKRLNYDPMLVENLVANASKYAKADVKLSKALFELLVPNEFKTYASALRNMVLIVDHETARYPWELMRTAEKGAEHPISVRAGLIRQLKTPNFRLDVEPAGGFRALVVGDPPLKKYKQLPGAAAEASLVVKILKAQGYEVDEHIQKPAMGIITDLMSTPYKIIHFAAHGVFKDPESGQTGIVLGDDSMLTPAIFKQLRYVPDLVFVNCCSLGQIDPAQEKLLQSKFEVAASIGCQLAEIGVKAVIVAGWEVEDNTAREFSTRLYQKMLRGYPYGKAVQEARQEIYRNYGSNNTWGAYQCYGDPFFNLTNNNSGSGNNSRRPADAEEAIQLLDNFINRQDTSFNRRNKSAKSPFTVLQQLDKEITSFNKDSRVIERLAEAYAKIGQFGLALQAYQQLGAIEKADFSYRSLEQMHNVSVRLLEEEYRKLDDKEKNTRKKEFKAMLNKAVDGLESLLKLGKTKERYSLIGSAWKRGFMMFKDSTMLEKSAEAYQNAYAIQETRGLDFYSFFNYAMAYELLPEKKDSLKRPTEAQATGNISNAAQKEMAEPNFWNKTAVSMAFLWNLIKANTEEEVEAEKKKLVANFKDAWKIEGNPNNKKSHLDQFIFVRIGIEANQNLELQKQKVQAIIDVEAAINLEND